MGKLTPMQMISDKEVLARNHALIVHLKDIGEPVLEEFINIFLEQNQDEEVLNAMLQLLYMLSGDASMSTVAPPKIWPLIAQLIDDLLNGRKIQKHIEKVQYWCREIADLLVTSAKHECLGMAADFCVWLMKRIELVHQQDEDHPEPHEIPHSYTPSSGKPYYFTPHGNQLRKMPEYVLDGESKRKKNYDDDPLIDDHCSKKYPLVSCGGFGHMLWFCPVHGHSYGFHLIAGGEGRKDPFASIYKYMELPPADIFYDNACQLSEYALNREPKWFMNTRFWHDLFHSITHKCGMNFKSGRVLGLEGINTEICEQVNAYLQCIKYTASHLTQEHFVFFVQFFLYLLNTEKTQKYKKQANIAIAVRL